MKKLLLMSLVTLVTLAAALFLIRWLAPQLLGLRPDLQVVQLSKQVPPFFNNVFGSGSGAENILYDDFIMNDPVSATRARNLLPRTNSGKFGPHDVLGFRNRSVPNVVDIVTIGDSQTYGINASLEENWPSKLATSVGCSVYNMSVGGWAAVQYLQMARYAVRFHPQVIVVAFYSGNDALESFEVAYNYEMWKDLRLSADLSGRDLRKVGLNKPESERGTVKFEDGIETVFKPSLRFASNDTNHPVVTTGWQIMAECAQRIAECVRQNSNAKLIFTIIPTKELVYAVKIRREGIKPSDDYLALIKDEQHNIEKLAGKLRALPNTRYVDLIQALQNSALQKLALYPSGMDGHPLAAGYAVIAEEIAQEAKSSVGTLPYGLLSETIGKNANLYYVSTPSGLWMVPTMDVLVANGWRNKDAPRVNHFRLEAVPWLGSITVDPARFNPKAMGFAP